MRSLLLVPLLALAIAACGPSQSGSATANREDSTPPPAPPSPSVSLGADPTSVTSGGSSMLTWSSTNAASCSASGGWSGAKATSGNQAFGNLTASSNYSLTCTGSGGSASASAAVTVAGTPPPPPLPTVSLAANPTSVASGGSSTLNWSSTNATSCSASGAWSDPKAISGNQSTGALTASGNYSLTCTGSGGSASDSAIVTVFPIPTVSLAANPTLVASGGSTMLTWSSTNATSCTASGAWSGSKALSGSESSGALTSSGTFALACTGPGGTAGATATITITAFGLDFPGSAGVQTTMRFQFLNPQLANPPLNIYPATYIWRAFPRQQSGYYTTFFWGTGGTEFFWDNGTPNSFYGAHPYPQNPPTGNTHYWEIATDRGLDVFGDSPVPVVYDRWYTQALVAWNTGSGKQTIFYYDLPDTSKFIDHTTGSSFGNIDPPAPALTWGDAPWIVPESPNDHGQGHEVYSGVLRGIRVYSTNLSLVDILSEASSPLSTPAGAAAIWYLNLDPTPGDISDKSGKGHDPAWVGNERPGLWSQ